MWTQTQIERIAVERIILRREGLVQFDVTHPRDSDSYHVYGTTYTNAGHAYDLWMPIPRGFPDARPALYTMNP